jgi:hypothetical protein
VSDAPAFAMPTQQDFERLFAFLDGNQKRAATKYDQIRRRLIKLFTWRDCRPPREFADRTIQIVVRRLNDGTDHRVSEPYQYFYNAAMTVLGEASPAHASEASPAPGATAAASGDDLMSDKSRRPPEDAERTSIARRLRPTIDASVDELVPKFRDLLIGYHRRHLSPTWREELAGTQGVPVNIMRLRVSRLRSAVERAARRSLRSADDGANGSPKEGLIS